MNEKEKKEFYVAMCRCCLIAEAMKSCSACRFNVGLTERVGPVEAAPIPLSLVTLPDERLVVQFEFAQVPSFK